MGDGQPVKLHIYDLSQGLARQLSMGLLGKQARGAALEGGSPILHPLEPTPVAPAAGRRLAHRRGAGAAGALLRPGPAGGPRRAHPLWPPRAGRGPGQDAAAGRRDTGLPGGARAASRAQHSPGHCRRLQAARPQEQKQVFTPGAYSLFDNNCNNFSDTFSTFLTGNGIPVRTQRAVCAPACAHARAADPSGAQSHITALPREVLATPFGQMIAPMLTQTVGQTLGQVSWRRARRAHRGVGLL